MRYILINSQDQTLTVMQGSQALQIYSISTAYNGLGEQINSFQTPRGWHRVHRKIGGQADPAAVFVSRKPTGETYLPALSSRFPGRDWIIARLLWLEGLEPGLNKGGSVDTLSRFIYIHGTPELEALGSPVSHGCIRMAPADIIHLFDHIDIHCKVLIE